MSSRNPSWHVYNDGTPRQFSKRKLIIQNKAPRNYKNPNQKQIILDELERMRAKGKQNTPNYGILIDVLYKYEMEELSEKFAKLGVTINQYTI